MKIVVCGAGKFGETLCLDLTKEGHEIMLIEKDQAVLEKMIARADISGVVGDAVSYDTQIAAGTEDADVFLAMTPSDEINLIATIIAAKIGAKYTIARIRNPEYSKHMSFVRGSLGVTRLINADREAARDISRMLSFPSAYGVETFVNGRINMIEVELQANSSLAGQSLKQLRTRYNSLLVCAVSRNNVAHIPGGDFVLEVGDRLQVTGLMQDLKPFYNELGTYRGKLRSLIIIGGGRITHYLLDMLTNSKRRITVIEQNPVTAERLAVAFPKVEVVQGDGSDFAFLDEQHIEHYDTLLALTGLDEENVVINLYANRRGVPRSIIKVNRTEMLGILQGSGLQTIITPKRLVSDAVLRHVRAWENSQGSNVEALYRLLNNQVEALEFIVSAESRAINIPLSDLKLKPNVLIAFIYRDGQIIFPGGRDIILPGDHIVVMSMALSFGDLDDILE